MTLSRNAGLVLQRALVASLALAAFACDSAPTRPDARELATRAPEVTAARAASAGPPPIPVVASVTDIMTVVQNAKIMGRDGGFSARIGNKSYWTFGDTPLFVPNATGKNWSDNTLSWTTDLDASDGLTLTHDYLDAVGVPAEFLPYTPFEAQYNYTHDPAHCSQTPCGAEYAMWPGYVIPDPKRGRALFFYHLLWRINGQATWTGLGGGFAVGLPDGSITRPILNPALDHPTMLWGPKFDLGKGAVVVGDTIFAYGCIAGLLVQHCKVGKATLAEALMVNKWLYYAGNNTWSSDQFDAVTIFDGGAAANQVFYNAYLGVYMVIYSGVYSDDVFYRVSYTPWGPWSARAFLFRMRPGWNGNTSYAAQAHAEYAQQNGKVQYVSYAHPTGFLRFDLPLAQIVWK